MMAGMSSLRRSLGLGLVLLAGCDGPSTSPTSAPATPVVAEVATPGVAEVAAGAEGVAGDAAGLVGWWRSGDVCLELFANGDFELSDIDDEPKVMVMGQASVTAEGPGRYSLQLTTARIWKGRYVSSCRKHHELGDFVASREMLGVGFTPGAASTNARYSGWAISARPRPMPCQASAVVVRACGKSGHGFCRTF